MCQKCMCQGFTEDQEKEKDKDSQDHGWRVEFPETAVWSSGEEDERKKKKEEKTPVSSSKVLFRFSSPIDFLQNRHSM